MSPNSHDDECRKCSTSRIPQASGEEDLPSGLRISRAAEAGEVDLKFLQYRGVLEVDRSPNHGPLYGATEVRRSETILLERGSQHRISVRSKANSTPSVLQQGTSQAEERGRRERQPRARCALLPPGGISLYRGQGGAALPLLQGVGRLGLGGNPRAHAGRRLGGKGGAAGPAHQTLVALKNVFSKCAFPHGPQI